MTRIASQAKRKAFQFLKCFHSNLSVCLSLGVVSSALFYGLPSHAVINLKAEQVGNDVVITGSGKANLSALTFLTSDTSFQNLFSDTQIYAGPNSFNDGDVDIYQGILTGPSVIGTDPAVFEEPDPMLSFGDLFGIQVDPYRLVLPLGYVSNTDLSGVSVYKNLTLSALGLSPGIGTWTWGDATNGTFDSINLNVVPGPLPIAGAAMTFGWCRKLRRRITAFSKM